MAGGLLGMEDHDGWWEVRTASSTCTAPGSRVATCYPGSIEENKLEKKSRGQLRSNSEVCYTD